MTKGSNHIRNDLHVILVLLWDTKKLYNSEIDKFIPFLKNENNSPFLYLFTNMACSKIFSGDLLELTDEILQYLRKDFSTLYSCILVNRLWCRLAIPLLWEDPFSKKCPKNYHFIEIYFSKLNKNSKALLKEYGINDNLLPSNTLFNYPSFIKYLDTNKICYSIKYWVDSLVDKYDDKLRNKLGNLVYRSLFEVFIENEGNIHSFRSGFYRYFNNNIDLILQNPNLTCNIRNLRLFSNVNVDSSQNTIPFLKFLYSNCNSISSIALANGSSLIEKHLSQIIISQNNLEKISFEYNTTLYNPFLSLKTSNCSNTLTTIIFYYIDFKNIISIVNEVFNQLNVLQSIHILYCKSLNSDFAQQIIKVNKPFKLISLFTGRILHIESLQLLLQKFSNCLENCGFENIGYKYNEKKQQLFELIVKYCTKIKYFDFSMSDDNNIYQFIKNNQPNINYLTIEVNIPDDYTNLSSTVFQNFGFVLPSKLEYLCLTFSFSAIDLEIFLINSQNTFIKKLLIKHKLYNENVDILFYIKKYIMKKERIKYLAISPDGDIDNGLFSLKDEVNEFKLHNIIVKKYRDLHINTYSYINNNYLQY